MALYRCNRCSKPPLMAEFEDNKDFCPGCGASGPPVVVELTAVHLLHAHPEGPITTTEGGRRIACMPKRTALASPLPFAKAFAATGDPRAVTCPACATTKAYKELAAMYEMEERARIVIGRNGEKKKVVEGGV